MNLITKRRLRPVVISLAIVLSVCGAFFSSPAAAREVSSVPDLPNMQMIDLLVVWNDRPTAPYSTPRDYSQGGYITVGGTASGVHTEGPQNLMQYGWPLEDGTTFSPGDTFVAPYDVLNGKSFNRSMGWSSWLSYDAVGQGYRWKITQTDCTPGFQTFDPYVPGFDELYTAGTGNAITWDGHHELNGVYQYDDPPIGDLAGWNGPDWMLHPAFAVPAQTGGIFAEYTIELVDSTGNVVSNVTPGYARLEFNASIPEPATLVLLLSGAMAMAAKRRRNVRNVRTEHLQ